MDETGSKDNTQMRKINLSSLFCRHDWEKENPITLPTALGKLPGLQGIKDDSGDIFYDRLILIFKCTKCNKLKIWKSYNNKIRQGR